MEKALCAIYVVSFLMSIGFGAYGVIVSLYMWSLGISFSGLGFAFGTFGFCMAAAGVLFGAHSDVVGRKRYFVLSLVLMSLVMFLYAHASELLHFLILEGLGGVSTSLSEVIVPTLMTDLTSDLERGEKFGRMGGFRWLGTGLGYFAGGFLSSLMDFSLVFFTVFILDALACLIVMLFVPPYHTTTEEVFSLSLLKEMRPQTKTWFVAQLIGAIATPAVEVIVVPIYLVEYLGVDVRFFGAFMASSYIFLSLTQFSGGKIADKYSRKLILLSHKSSPLSL